MQYENKSYRRFVEWLEITNLLDYLQLKRIPHFTILQKFASRISNSFLQKVLISFATTCNNQEDVVVGIDATGFKSAFSQYYDDITCNTTSVNKRPFIKSILCADTNKQMICHIKIRHSYAHDNIDFIPILSSIQNALPISLVVADKGYDD